jgi:hypothetical protein
MDMGQLLDRMYPVEAALRELYPNVQADERMLRLVADFRFKLADNERLIAENRKLGEQLTELREILARRTESLSATYAELERVRLSGYVARGTFRVFGSYQLHGSDMQPLHIDRIEEPDDDGVSKVVLNNTMSWPCRHCEDGRLQVFGQYGYRCLKCDTRYEPVKP